VVRLLAKLPWKGNSRNPLLYQVRRWAYALLTSLTLWSLDSSDTPTTTTPDTFPTSFPPLSLSLCCTPASSSHRSWPLAHTETGRSGYLASEASHTHLFLRQYITIFRLVPTTFFLSPYNYLPSHSFQCTQHGFTTTSLTACFQYGFKSGTEQEQDL